jgi:hypothetical protein
MMIARNWIKAPVNVAGRQPSSPLQAKKIAGVTPACFANTRDREVPYGMKGGEY